MGANRATGSNNLKNKCQARSGLGVRKGYQAGMISAGLFVLAVIRDCIVCMRQGLNMAMRVVDAASPIAIESMPVYFSFDQV